MDVTIACPCPPDGQGAPRHETDTVTLRDRLGFREATIIRKALGFVEGDGEERAAEVLAVLTEHYVLYGISRWTLVDEKGRPVEPNPATVRARLLDNPEAFAQATEIADAADELYQAQVLLPLLARASRSSPPTPTVPSTSAPKASTPTPPKPSKRSSTSTTRTDGTAATSSSLVGVSSSSPSSTSA